MGTSGIITNILFINVIIFIHFLSYQYPDGGAQWRELGISNNPDYEDDAQNMIDWVVNAKTFVKYYNDMIMRFIWNIPSREIPSVIIR